MTIQSVPLSSLQPPSANPRTALDTETLEGLAASISADGLLQNLVVARGRGKSYRIISGERRYRALKLLAERGAITADHEVPVEIRSKLSNDDKLRLATVENVQRENLPPLDEARAFAALIRKGATLEDVAARTGLSRTTIKRRLVLNDLCEEAKTALSAGAITLAQAEALTLGDHEAQRSVLGDIEAGYGPYSGADIRDHLLYDRPSVAMAIFPVEQYTGTITTDLFAADEASYFDDAAQFFALQQDAVERLAREYEDKAAWVEVTGSYRIPDWQYRPAGEGEDGGVLINLSPSGRVEVREGLARPDIDSRTRAQTADNPVAPRKPKATYAAPLRRYMAWHKSVAVAEMLLADPRKAKEVAAVHALAGFRPHEGVEQLGKAAEPQSAYAALESQARLFAGWLGFEIDDEKPFWSQFPARPLDALALYEAVKGLSDHDLDGLHVLLTALQFGQVDCDRLDTADSLFNAVAQDLGAAMRNHWRPDRAFLARRTRDQLITIARQCGYADGVGSVASYKKTDLVEALLRHFQHAQAAAEPTAAQQKARAWLPEAMAFPAVDPDDPQAQDDSEGPACDDELEAAE